MDTEFEASEEATDEMLDALDDAENSLEDYFRNHPGEEDAFYDALAEMVEHDTIEIPEDF